MSKTAVPIVPGKASVPAKDWIGRRPLLSFFVLSYGIMFVTVFSSMWLKIPFFGIPWFLAVFSPTISALILSAVTGGMSAVKQLLQGYILWYDLAV